MHLSLSLSLSLSPSSISLIPTKPRCIVKRSPLERTLKRFVSLPFSWFLSFHPVSVFAFPIRARVFRVRIRGRVHRDEGEKGNLYPDSASHARRVFCTPCDATAGSLAFTRSGKRSWPRFPLTYPTCIREQSLEFVDCNYSSTVCDLCLIENHGGWFPREWNKVS